MRNRCVRSRQFQCTGLAESAASASVLQTSTSVRNGRAAVRSWNRWRKWLYFSQPKISVATLTIDLIEGPQP
jgi:hypothetical protein